MKDFTIENWLTFISIGVPVIAASIGFIVSLILKHREDRRINRPIIFISYEKKNINGLYTIELTIKNYGNITGWIESVEITPAFKPDKLMPNTFTNFKNFPLAPNQQITTIISAGQKAELELSDERKFTIVYKPGFSKVKPFKEEYTVNEQGYPTIMFKDNYNTQYRLNEINKTLTKINNTILKKDW